LVEELAGVVFVLVEELVHTAVTSCARRFPFSKLINRTTELNKNNKEISDNSQSQKIRTTELLGHQHWVVVNVVDGLFCIIKLLMGVFSSRVSQT